MVPALSVNFKMAERTLLNCSQGKYESVAAGILTRFMTEDDRCVSVTETAEKLNVFRKAGVQFVPPAFRASMVIEDRFSLKLMMEFTPWKRKNMCIKAYDNLISCTLRKGYESGRIRTENEFKEVLKRVLSDYKEI